MQFRNRKQEFVNVLQAVTLSVFTVGLMLFLLVFLS